MRSAEFDVRPSMPHAELNTLHSAFRTPHFRVGWGRGKFVAWVAATRAKPGGAFIVPPGEEGAGAPPSAPHRVARAGGARPGRARARRLVARRGHAQGSLR